MSYISNYCSEIILNLWMNLIVNRKQERIFSKYYQKISNVPNYLRLPLVVRCMVYPFYVLLLYMLQVRVKEYLFWITFFASFGPYCIVRCTAFMSCCSPQMSWHLMDFYMSLFSYFQFFVCETVCKMSPKFGWGNNCPERIFYIFAYIVI